MSKILVTGGSGFLGTLIMRELIQRGHDVVCLDIVPPRQPYAGAFIKLDVQQSLLDHTKEELRLLENVDAVIHLLGKNIFGRFTTEHKQAIYNSRVIGSRNLCELWRNELYRPKVCISASAVGYYGDKKEETCDEVSKHGESFLSHVVIDWENEIMRARELGVRVACIRNGHILGAGGLLGVLLPYYRVGLGGPLGDGKQWMPWIHISDLVRLYIEALENDTYEGIYLGIAPDIVRNRDFSKVVAHTLRKIHIFFIPYFVLKVLYGEFADEMISSQRVVATRGATSDLAWFKFPTLQKALADILK